MITGDHGDAPYGEDILDQIPSLIATYDPAGRHLRVNRAIEQFTGLSRDQLIGKTWAEASGTNPGSNAWADRISEVVRTGQQLTYDMSMTGAAGELRSFHLVLVPQVDAAGRVASVLSVAHDVTESLHAIDARTRELWESELRFRTVLDHAAAAIWAWDANGVFFVNRALADITGYSESEIRSPGFFRTLLHPDDRAGGKAIIASYISGDAEPARRLQEIRIVRKDGEVRWLRLESSVVDLDGRRGVLAVATDNTEIHLAEEERRRFEEKLQQIQKLESLGLLAGGIAHDFNNLLVGILGNAGLAMMEAAPGSSLMRTLMDLETAASRAADLTSQMLAYSGKGHFLIATVDLSAVAVEMAALLRASTSKRVALEYDFADGVPPVDVDVTQIRQVIMNLIVNASDAIDEERGGVVTIRTRTVYADRAYLAESYIDPELDEGTYVAFEVSDTGSGMDPETRAHIFEPFFTTKFNGRGLGLAAVLGIVRGHRGALKVQSEPGVGTTVQVLLPPSAGAFVPSMTPEPASSPWTGGGTILVVDDDPIVRTVVSRMLEISGFSALTAPDGLRALEQLDQHGSEIAAILLDLTMPGMDGAETYRALRDRHSQVPVILTSGYTEDDATRTFIGQGLAGFIQKPFRPAELIAKLREVLQG